MQLRRSNAHRKHTLRSVLQQRLRAGFLQLAEAEPQRLQVIDALGTQQEVTAKVLQVIGRVISGEK